MERRTKLVGGYLGLCCFFMVFMCVSSVSFYNPHEYIKKIASLLDELQHDLKHTHIDHVRMDGFKMYDLEHGENCPGTILDAFQRGTQVISNLVLNCSLLHITDSIDDCVAKLRIDCSNVQKHDLNCNDASHKETVTDFVKGFKYFTTLLMKWDTCKVEFIQGYELSEDYNPDQSISICGKR